MKTQSRQGAGLEQLSLHLGHDFTLRDGALARYLCLLLVHSINVSDNWDTCISSVRWVTLFLVIFAGSHAAACVCTQQAKLSFCCCWVRWQHLETQAADPVRWILLGGSCPCSSAKLCQQSGDQYGLMCLYPKCKIALIWWRQQILSASLRVWAFQRQFLFSGSPLSSMHVETKYIWKGMGYSLWIVCHSGVGLASLQCVSSGQQEVYNQAACSGDHLPTPSLSLWRVAALELLTVWSPWSWDQNLSPELPEACFSIRLLHLMAYN